MTSCSHTYKVHTGLVEVYEYCDKCGKKQTEINASERTDSFEESLATDSQVELLIRQYTPWSSDDSTVLIASQLFYRINAAAYWQSCHGYVADELWLSPWDYENVCRYAAQIGADYSDNATNRLMTRVGAVVIRVDPFFAQGRFELIDSMSSYSLTRGDCL